MYEILTTIYEIVTLYKTTVSKIFAISKMYPSQVTVNFGARINSSSGNKYAPAQ